MAHASRLKPLSALFFAIIRIEEGHIVMIFKSIVPIQPWNDEICFKTRIRLDSNKEEYKPYFKHSKTKACKAIKTDDCNLVFGDKK